MKLALTANELFAAVIASWGKRYLTDANGEYHDNKERRSSLFQHSRKPLQRPTASRADFAGFGFRPDGLPDQRCSDWPAFAFSVFQHVAIGCGQLLRLCCEWCQFMGNSFVFRSGQPKTVRNFGHFCRRNETARPPAVEAPTIGRIGVEAFVCRPVEAVIANLRQGVADNDELSQAVGNDRFAFSQKFGLYDIKRPLRAFGFGDKRLFRAVKDVRFAIPMLMTAELATRWTGILGRHLRLILSGVTRTEAPNLASALLYRKGNPAHAYPI
jgi:hypothetical protein